MPTTLEFLVKTCTILAVAHGDTVRTTRKRTTHAMKVPRTHEKGCVYCYDYYCTVAAEAIPLANSEVQIVFRSKQQANHNNEWS